MDGFSRTFKHERRRSVRQRLTACGWEEMRADQTDVWPLYDWSFYRPLPPRHAAKIRELGGSLAHICHVWKPDSACLSAQAHRPRAGQQKFKPDVFIETSGVWMTMPKREIRFKDFQVLNPLFFNRWQREGVTHTTLLCQNLGKGGEPGHPTG